MGAGDASRMIEATALTRRFTGTGGVEDLTLHVPRGTIVGLVGPSGSGKTTAVRLLLGIDRPEHGHVEVLDRDPGSFRRRDRARLGYLPQHEALVGDLTLRHNLQLMASLFGLPLRTRLLPGKRRRAARQRIDRLLELLDLADVQHTRFRDASGGERRRLALAAALVHEPELLVLDEPTTGIDPVLRQRLWEHFVDLRDDGVTMLVTTQYVGEAVHCDLIAMLIDGQVVAMDTPAALREQALGPHASADVPYDEVFVRLVEDHRHDTAPGPATSSGEVA